MKRIQLIFVIIIFLWVGCAPRESQPLDREDVDELVDQWLRLWSTYDLNMLGEIFWDDASMTYFSSERRGLIKGFESMRPHHEAFGFVDGGKKPDKELWLEDIDVTLQPTFAVVGAVWYFGDRTMSTDSVQNGPVSFVILQDKDGKIKIGHTHFANY